MDILLSISEDTLKVYFPICLVSLELPLLCSLRCISCWVLLYKGPCPAFFNFPQRPPTQAAEWNYSQAQIINNLKLKRVICWNQTSPVSRTAKHVEASPLPLWARAARPHWPPRLKSLLFQLVVFSSSPRAPRPTPHHNFHFPWHRAFELGVVSASPI